MIAVVHTWEEHVLSILIFVFMTYYKVRVFLVLVCFLLTCIDRCTLFDNRLAHIAVLLKSHL